MDEDSAPEPKRHFHFDIPEGTRLTSLEDWPAIFYDPDL